VTPKEFIVVGGPNGAGKTTFAEEYASHHGFTYVSADAIAARLSPDNPALAQLAAGREVLARIKQALAGAESFVAESTLAGRTFQRILRDAKTMGFRVTIVYLFMDSPDACLERVHRRVQKGGHPVPEADVRRRFTRSILNFCRVYRPLSDHWVLMYNGASQPQDAAFGTATHISIRDAELWALFQRLIEPS